MDIGDGNGFVPAHPTTSTPQTASDTGTAEPVPSTSRALNPPLHQRTTNSTGTETPTPSTSTAEASLIDFLGLTPPTWTPDEPGMTSTLPLPSEGEANEVRVGLGGGKTNVKHERALSFEESLRKAPPGIEAAYRYGPVEGKTREQYEIVQRDRNHNVKRERIISTPSEFVEEMFPGKRNPNAHWNANQHLDSFEAVRYLQHRVPYLYDPSIEAQLGLGPKTREENNMWRPHKIPSWKKQTLTELRDCGEGEPPREYYSHTRLLTGDPCDPLSLAWTNSRVRLRDTVFPDQATAWLTLKWLYIQVGEEKPLPKHAEWVGALLKRLDNLVGREGDSSRTTAAILAIDEKWSMALDKDTSAEKLVERRRLRAWLDGEEGSLVSGQRHQLAYELCLARTLQDRRVLITLLDPEIDFFQTPQQAMAATWGEQALPNSRYTLSQQFLCPVWVRVREAMFRLAETWKVFWDSKYKHVTFNFAWYQNGSTRAQAAAGKGELKYFLGPISKDKHSFPAGMHDPMLTKIVQEGPFPRVGLSKMIENKYRKNTKSVRGTEPVPPDVSIELETVKSKRQMAIEKDYLSSGSQGSTSAEYFPATSESDEFSSTPPESPIPKTPKQARDRANKPKGQTPKTGEETPRGLITEYYSTPISTTTKLASTPKERVEFGENVTPANPKTGLTNTPAPQRRGGKAKSRTNTGGSEKPKPVKKLALSTRKRRKTQSKEKDLASDSEEFVEPLAKVTKLELSQGKVVNVTGELDIKPESIQAVSSDEEGEGEEEAIFYDLTSPAPPPANPETLPSKQDEGKDKGASPQLGTRKTDPFAKPI